MARGAKEITLLGQIVDRYGYDLAGIKRPLNHDDYDGWQSIRGQTISRDGNWVAFTVSPQVGDGELIVRHTSKDTTYRHARGSGARFSPDGRYLAFRIDVLTTICDLAALCPAAEKLSVLSRDPLSFRVREVAPGIALGKPRRPREG